MALVLLFAVLIGPLVLPFVLIHYAEEYMSESDTLQILLGVTGVVGILIAAGVVVQFSTCFWETSGECRERDSWLLRLLLVYGIAWTACVGAFLWAVWPRGRA